MLSVQGTVDLATVVVKTLRGTLGSRARNDTLVQLFALRASSAVYVPVASRLRLSVLR